MNQEMMQLYQQVILDHNKNPRNFGKMDDYDIMKEGHNPLCGDHFHLYIKLNPEKNIERIMFAGEGCAISKASASMMTMTLMGKSIAEVNEKFSEFQKLITRQLDPEKDTHSLGKLKIFSGIWKYPARVKCAGLCWHTVHAAMMGDEGIVKTE